MSTSLSITESWLTEGDDGLVNEMCPPGYGYIGRSRNSRGGGVGVFHKESIDAIPEDKTEYTSFECLSVLLKSKTGRTTKLIVIYRPPPSQRNKLTTSTFFQEFEELLSAETLFPGPLIIVGDFNIHIDCKSDPVPRRFVELMEVFDLTQHVSDITHRQGHIIDFVLTRKSDNLVRQTSVLPRVMSDHHAISCTISHACMSENNKTMYRRKYRSIDTVAFARDLRASLEKADIASASGMDNATECITSCLDSHAPLRQHKTRKRCHHPWYNDTIHAERVSRRRLERKWKKSKLESDRSSYMIQRKLVIDLIRDAKQKYYHDRLSDAAPKEAFRVIKDLIASKACPLPMHTDDKQLADDFLEFFSQKIVKIREVLDNTVTTPAREPDLIKPPSMSSFTDIDVPELRKIILRSRTTSCPLDAIPTWLLKDDNILEALLPSLAQIINTSLNTGTVPEVFKTALIVPLLKKQGLDVNEQKNYRPVSNLQFVGKLAEKAAAQQLTSHMHDHNVNDPLQSAYRQGHCTETALIKVKDDITRSIDRDEGVLMAMLDLSAAFDTVDHEVLIRRLHDLVGVEGIALDWFKSYLHERSQKVIINNISSHQKTLSTGVPQGSVLGPLLFLVYMLPLRHIIKRHQVLYHGYADDTQLYVTFHPKSPSSLSNAIKRLERCVADVQDWLTKNKLKLNGDKTEFVIYASNFHLKKIIELDPRLRVGQTDIIPSAGAKNLGVVLDSALSMNKHISQTTKSMYFHIRSIRQIRHYLDKQTCVSAVMALVTSRLDYCNALLCGITKQSLNRLQVAHNSAARLITNTRRRDHITPVLYELHWLPVVKRIQFKSLLLVFKALHISTAPSYLRNMFVLSHQNASRPLRSSDDTSLLSVARTRCSYGDRSFSVCSAKLWISLPQDIRNSPSVAVFKSKLKTFLFKSHYSC